MAIVPAREDIDGTERAAPAAVPSEVSSRYRLRSRHMPEIAFWACVPVSIVFLLVINRHQWFRADDYNFIILRRGSWEAGQYADTLFAPHNEHWSTGALLVYMGVFQIVRMSSYLPYLALALAANVAYAVAVRGVLRRIDLDRWLVAAGGVLILFLGSGGENQSWAFQVSFIGAVALGLFGLLVSDHDGGLRLRDVGGVLLVIASLTFSGTALTVLAVVVANALWNRRWAVLAAYGLLPGAMYGAWHLVWGRQAVRMPLDLPAVPAYMVTGLDAAIEGLTQLPDVTGPLIVLVAVGCVWRARAGRLNGLAVVCAGGAVLFYLVNGISRSSLGADQALAHRYITIAAGLLLPAVLALLDELLHYDRARGRWVAGALLGWALAGNVAAGITISRAFSEENRGHREKLAAAAALPSFAELDGSNQVDPGSNALVTVGALRDMFAHDRLVLPAPSPQAMLTAAATVQVLPGTGIAGDPAGMALIPLDDTTAQPDGGCVRLSSASGRLGMRLHTPGRAEVVFREAIGPLTVSVIGPNGSWAPASRTQDTTSLILDHPDYPVEVRLPSAGAMVCGAHVVGGQDL
jgi:hypothetical protein